MGHCSNPGEVALGSTRRECENLGTPYKGTHKHLCVEREKDGQNITVVISMKESQQSNQASEGRGHGHT